MAKPPDDGFRVRPAKKRVRPKRGPRGGRHGATVAGGNPRAKLNAKQELFLRWYLQTRNAQLSAMRAGYCANNAHNASGAASRLLSYPAIRRRVAQADQRALERAEVRAADVIAELAKIGFSNLADFIRLEDDGTASVDLSLATRDQLAALQEIKVSTTYEGRGEERKPVNNVKLKLAPKREALELIGKHLGVFKDGPEVMVPVRFIISGLPAPEQARLPAPAPGTFVIEGEKVE